MSAPPRRNAGVPSNAKMPSSPRTVHGRDRSGPPFAAHVDRVDVATCDHHRHVGRWCEGRGRRLTAQEHTPVRSRRDGGDPTRRRPEGDTTDCGTLPERFAPILGRGVGPRLRAAERPERQDGGEERCGHQAAPDLFAEHRDLDRAQPESAVLRGHLDGQPSLVRHGRPYRPVVTVRHVRRDRHRRASVRRVRRCGITGARQRSHDRPRAHARPERIVPGQPIEQCGRGGAQRLLIGREVEVHGGAV